MPGSQSENIIDLRIISYRLVLFLFLFLVMFFLSGCGAKKVAVPIMEEEETVVEIDPVQQRFDEWYTLMREKRFVSEMEKLESVNSFFNKLNFVDDLDVWGMEDYWATPQEMLISNAGDCEDFAFAKYFTLRNLSIPDEKMRLTYVKKIRWTRPHMVLSYYREPTSDPLVLDSLIDSILSASKRTDLIPIYSFNVEGLWLDRKETSVRLGSSDHLSLWQELLRRFRHEEAFAAPIPQQ